MTFRGIFGPRVERAATATVHAAVAVHRELGPGLLESCYEACMEHVLVERGHHVERQLRLPVRFRGIEIEQGFRIDLRVDGLILVELKAVEKVPTIAIPQLLTYLRLSGAPVGFLMNFSAERMIDGMQRVILSRRMERHEHRMRDEEIIVVDDAAVGTTETSVKASPA